MEPANLFYFLGASALLTLAPGPDILFVIAQGVSWGRRAAIETTLGLTSGIIVHTTAAALGLSAIFNTSALAFQTLKFAGAAYLLYMAWRALREHGRLACDTPTARSAGLIHFRRCFLMNVLNPKVCLFFFVFLPQFVTPQAGHITAQLIMLGLIFMVQAIVIFGTVGIFAGSVGERLLRNPRVSKFMGYVSATVLGVLGLRLALARR